MWEARSTGWKRLPDAVRGRAKRIAPAGPILHAVPGRERRGPGDADGVDLQLAAEVERDPLRVTGFAGEGFRQIGIAFPVSARIAGSVAHGEAAMRQRRRPGMPDRFRGSCITHKVTFLGPRIAPLTVRIPVPGFRESFGILPIAHGLQTPRLDLADK